ncbi:hypothetical protein [Streptomyces canus]|uniref:hypothetical protein n=1 Tax=Streptomyces canus TaxID=58343 RepID=UPI003F6B18FC
MTWAAMGSGQLPAVSDLHIGYEENRALVESIGPARHRSSEGPCPVWDGPDGPVAVTPLFPPHDYGLPPAGCTIKDEGPGDLPTGLVRHYPLDRHPTAVPWYPEFKKVSAGHPRDWSPTPAPSGRAAPHIAAGGRNR